MTQFIGTIPPGRSPHHSHVYDEVIYVLTGEGTLHVEGREFPIQAGTCMHLPPLVEHALENEGETPMRVLACSTPPATPRRARTRQTNENKRSLNVNMRQNLRYPVRRRWNEEIINRGGSQSWPRSLQQDRARARRSSDPLRTPVPARRWSIAERRRRSASPTRRRARAASIGVYQIHWAQFFASQWNKTHKRNKIRIVQGDTKLPDTASALSVAHQFASNGRCLGLVGPAGSQEVQDTAAVFKSGGLAIVSGSATRVTLTRAQGGKPRDTPKGFFFRTVPNDGQQGDRVAVWIAGS